MKNKYSFCSGSFDQTTKTYFCGEFSCFSWIPFLNPNLQYNQIFFFWSGSVTSSPTSFAFFIRKMRINRKREQKRKKQKKKGKKIYSFHQQILFYTLQYLIVRILLQSKRANLLSNWSLLRKAQ